jgi:integrase
LVSSSVLSVILTVERSLHFQLRRNTGKNVTSSDDAATAGRLGYGRLGGDALAAVKRAGLKKITFRMFRHTIATRLLRNGADIVTVKEIMGHSNISTTLRYVHPNAGQQRRAMEKLGTSDKVVTIVPRSAAG